MRPQLLTLTACCALAVHAGPAPAQAPPGYGASPAYRHFLNSPYGVRTYSRLTPGGASTYGGPFGVGTNYVEPGRTNQRITPAGLESEEYVPGYGSSFETPWSYQGYNAQGYVRRSFTPPYPAAPAPVVVAPPVYAPPIYAEPPISGGPSQMTTSPDWYWDGREWRYSPG